MPTESRFDNGRNILVAFQQRAFASLLAADVVIDDQAQATCIRGRDATEKFLLAFFRDGFPGAEIAGTVVEATAAGTVLALTLCGVQNGRFMGIPPTGRAVKLSLTLVCRLRQGQICRLELNYDAAGLLRQLGLAL